MKRYIVSDIHTGNDVTDYNKVMAFLELVDQDADELLILGDWMELLWSNFNIVSKVEPYSSTIVKIRQIASRKPVKAVLGNHDWNLGFFASHIEPVEIIEPFSEGGVYYTHGSQWDWVSVILGTPVDPIWWSQAMPFVFPTQFFLWLAAKVWAGAEDEYYWGIAYIHERARAYAMQNGYHTVVFGHTHFPSEEYRGGVRLYNSGDFVDSFSYLTEEDGIINLRFL